MYTNSLFTVEDIEHFINSSSKIKIIGNKERIFKNVCSLSNGNPDGLSFCNIKNNSAFSVIEESKAGIIFSWNNANTPIFENKTLILVENPRLWFIRCANHFFPQEKQTGIHPSVIMGENCIIEDDVYIGPYAVIGNDVTIKNASVIGSHVKIFNGVKIGREVKIKSSCVIGSDGFGFEKNDRGEYERFPHYGSVVIGNQVEIGANTCIDRGTLSNTIVGDGTKIDNLVHIAHNVEIGKNCVIVCLSCIAGSVRIGDGVWIAPQVVIRDGIQVGKGAIVGMGAVVTKDVDSFDIVAGVPAKSIKEKGI